MPTVSPPARWTLNHRKGSSSVDVRPEPRLITFAQRVILPRGADPLAAREAGATAALCDPADASAVEAAGLVSVTSPDAPAGLARLRAFPSHPAKPGEAVVVHADDPDIDL